MTRKTTRRRRNNRGKRRETVKERREQNRCTLSSEYAIRESRKPSTAFLLMEQKEEKE